MVIVSSPEMCGCCGEPPVNSAVAHPRCGKHEGRNPCVVPGCGRTFALQPGETWDVQFVCGKHWKMAPKGLRDRCTEIRKLARRKGWTPGLLNLHSNAWQKAVDAVIGGDTLVPEEINELFGFEDK